MKDRTKTEIKVGITVILGILLFLWILSWAKNLSITESHNIVKVKFENVAGLEIGDEVTINGVRKGYVDDFNIQGSTVIVKLSIEEEAILRKDAEFSIRMLDLMGGKKVEISPGSSEENLDFNKTHIGTFYADIPYVMSMIGSAQDDLNQVLQDVKVTLSSLNNYLTDEQLNRDLKTTLSNLSTVTQKLNVMIDENRTSIKELVENSTELTSDAKDFISENKDDIKYSLGSLKGILSKTDSLLTKLNAFSDEVINKENNFGKLMYDENVYNDLNKSLDQLNELTKLLIHQLKTDGVKVDAYIF